jgi:hypothetical protein
VSLATGSAFATLAAQGAGGAIASGAEISLAERLANACVAPFRYLARTVWPVDLSVLYPHPALPGGRPIGAATAALAAIALAAIVIAACWALARRGRPAFEPLAAGTLLFLGLLLPTLGLVQVGEQADADRYSYLPHLGLFAGLVFAARRGAAPRRPATLAMLLLLALLGGATAGQSLLWRDSETLLEASLAATPDNPVLLWLAAREDLAAGRADRAGVRLARAIELRPIFAEARTTLAEAFRRRGLDAQAEQQLELALAIHPSYPPALAALADLRQAAGDALGAAQLRRRARGPRAPAAD